MIFSTQIHIFLLIFFSIQTSIAHITNSDQSQDTSGYKGVQGGFSELDVEIPPEEKGFAYYLVIAVFVLATIFSTMLNAAFLLISAVFWKHFRGMTFFWILTQLTFAVFVVSILNLIINVPATVFSMLTKEFVQSDVFIIITHLIDVCNYAILFSNLVIAIQRFFVFFIPNTFERSFKSPFIFIWFILIWVVSALMTFIFYYNSCLYKYTVNLKYELTCESTKTTLVKVPNPTAINVLDTALQILIPLANFVVYLAIIIKIAIIRQSNLSKQELSILKQAIIIFVMFQFSSTIFLLCQIFTFQSYIAFIIKRLINSTLLLAGTATPLFFFATSSEVRRVFRSSTSSGTFMSVSSNAFANRERNSRNT
ncbi:unnamed protein product [Caenorhabditis angaria]|uniref:G-protein coupled receptors family 1 profile domain-containing protein n=1 Tax=Caenorhabditis angaria TaxID=860376 RepID=A0A9P1N7E7_9PELO|nr:unnamed protein product [Caenorhabditis angaria]